MPTDLYGQPILTNPTIMPGAGSVSGTDLRPSSEKKKSDSNLGTKDLLKLGLVLGALFAGRGGGAQGAGPNAGIAALGGITQGLQQRKERQTRDRRIAQEQADKATEAYYKHAPNMDEDERARAAEQVNVMRQRAGLPEIGTWQPEQPTEMERAQTEWYKARAATEGQPSPPNIEQGMGTLADAVRQGVMSPEAANALAKSRYGLEAPAVTKRTYQPGVSPTEAPRAPLGGVFGPAPSPERSIGTVRLGAYKPGTTTITKEPGELFTTPPPPAGVLGARERLFARIVDDYRGGADYMRDWRERDPQGYQTALTQAFDWYEEQTGVRIPFDVSGVPGLTTQEKATIEKTTQATAESKVRAELAPQEFELKERKDKLAREAFEHKKLMDKIDNEIAVHRANAYAARAAGAAAYKTAAGQSVSSLRDDDRMLANQAQSLRGKIATIKRKAEEKAFPGGRATAEMGKPIPLSDVDKEEMASYQAAIEDIAGKRKQISRELQKLGIEPVVTPTKPAPAGKRKQISRELESLGIKPVVTPSAPTGRKAPRFKNKANRDWVQAKVALARKGNKNASKRQIAEAIKKSYSRARNWNVDAIMAEIP